MNNPLARVTLQVPGCLCHDGLYQPCICGPDEVALRYVMAKGCTLNPDERAWCLREIRRIEGWGDYVSHDDDAQLARDVLNAWTDLCFDKGAL